MKPLFLPILILFLITPTNIYPSILEKDYYVTDKALKEIAIRKGIVPKDIDKAYIDEETKKGNTLHLWIVASRDEKVKIVDVLKDLYREEEKAIIRNPSMYYVDEMNFVMFTNILHKAYDYSEGKGLKILLGTVAAMEGDYNDGKSRVEALRNFLGDKVFEQYKRDYPEKYQYLVEMDKEAE